MLYYKMEISKYYNLDYELKYFTFDDEVIGDMAYRTDLMNVFNITIIDNKLINDDVFKEMKEKQNGLYEILKENEDFNKFMDLLVKKKKYVFFIGNDTKMAFSLLFNYDSFWMTHGFLKSVNSKNIEKLEYYNKKILNFIKNNDRGWDPPIDIL